MRLQDAHNIYLGEVARRYTPATVRKYSQILSYFLDDFEYKNVTEITRDDVEKWLTRWSHKSKATMALHTSIIKCFFRFLVKRGDLAVSPARDVDRPKLPKPEDRDVVVVSTQDVKKMFGACQDWGDEICLAILGYTAARRNAVSRLRWTDVDLQGDADSKHGWIKFREKGSKVFEKPIDSKLRLVLDRAPAHEPDDYVVPNFQPTRVSRTERDNRIVYDRVKRIAARAGVVTHVHAIRAAFAVFFLESRRGDVAELKEWLGHDRLDTTQNYLRGLNRRKALTRSLGMDWGITAGQTGTPNGSLSERGSQSATAHRDWAEPSGDNKPLSESDPESALTEGAANLSGDSGRGSSIQPDRAQPAPSVSALSEEGSWSMPASTPETESGVLRPSSESASLASQTDSEPSDRVTSERRRGAYGIRTRATDNSKSHARSPVTGQSTGKEVAGSTHADHDTGVSKEKA